MSKEPKFKTQFIHGLAEIHFAGKMLGLVSEDAVSWGGDEPSFTQVFAAQSREAPVLNLRDNPGSIVLEGDFIEFSPTSLVEVLGGKATGAKWEAPASDSPKEGTFKIVSASGGIITIPRASLTARITGSFKHNELLKVHFKVTVLSNGADAPYTIEMPTETTTTVSPGAGVGG